MTTQAPLQRRASLWSLAIMIAVVWGATRLGSWWQDERTAASITSHIDGQRITLYTTVTCVYCARARQWLASHDIPWDECDVELDRGCQQTYEAQGAPGTPLVRIGRQWHLGFEPAWIAQVLQTPAKPAVNPAPAR